MPLKSAILVNNARLENAAGGGPSVKKRPPDDDVDAVQRIQRALVKLGARMPISFPNGPEGEPDGKFGDETFNAVLAFQKKHFPSDASQWDGRAGQHTLAKMDALLPVAPAPPSPTPPGPRPILNRNEAIKAIRDYLIREQKTDVAKTLMDRPENMVLLGETHNIFDASKAFLLVQLVQEARRKQMVTTTSFHASERFMNDDTTRDKINDFMRASPLQQAALMPQLTGDLLIFAPVLVEASRFPQNRYGILPINAKTDPGAPVRQELLARGFNDAAARCKHVPLGSINSRTSRGNILIGAQHAARVETFGTGLTTTCGHLIKAGWQVHVVRLTATKEPFRDERVNESLNLVLRDPAADHTPIDCVEIADSISGGRPFYADLTKSDSPFSQLHLARRADIPLNKLFDALVHLPAPL